MITFLEFLGLGIIILIKHKDTLFRIFRSIYDFICPPPPVWDITNFRELTSRPSPVGETIRVQIKYVKQVPDEELPTAFTEALETLQIQIKQNNQSIIFLKDIIHDERLVILKFSVQRALPCNLNVFDQTICIKFCSGPPDPEKFRLLKPLPIVKCTTFETKCIKIQPRDKFENNCKASIVSLVTFQFLISSDDSNWNCNDSSSICTCTFNFVGDVVHLNITFNRPGIFHGTILYKNTVIGTNTFGSNNSNYGSTSSSSGGNVNGRFSIVSITNAEETSLQYILANSPSWKYHKGKLLVLNESVVQKSREIYIYVSSKQLYVQEYFLKFIPVKVATFRVSSMTKLDLLFADNDQKTYTFSIRDGIQPKVTIEMNQSYARIVYAMFTHFLQLRYGNIGSESFTDKQNFFYTELNAIREKEFTSLITFAPIYVQRNDLLNSSMQCTTYFHKKDWGKHFKIEFVGEEGIDGGGLKREWFDLICTNLFDHNPNGLFCSFGNSRLVHPNPAAYRDSRFTKKYYEFAGKIVGKCLIESARGNNYRIIVNGRFTRSFFAQILGLRPNFKHFEQDDPELFMSKIKYILENDIESMELTFSDDEYKSDGQFLKAVDLVPNGSKKLVTNENKEEYLNALANYRLGTKVKKEMESFIKGLHELIPDELLSQFDENELELLMCGKSEFDVEDLKKHYDRSFISSIDPAYQRVLEWFWISVTKMTYDERAKLLQFITGSSLLPNGGFGKLNPKIRIILGAEFGKLPTAQTCANQLCLSDQDSFETFEKCLLFAVNEGSQGFGFR